MADVLAAEKAKIVHNFFITLEPTKTNHTKNNDYDNGDKIPVTVTLKILWIINFTIYETLW
jgi:hypothetical protein